MKEFKTGSKYSSYFHTRINTHHCLLHNILLKMKKVILFLLLFLPFWAKGQYTSHLMPVLFPEGVFECFCYVEPSLEDSVGPYGMGIIHEDTSYYLITKEVVDWHSTVFAAMEEFPFRYEKGLDETGRAKEQAYNKQIQKKQEETIRKSLMITEERIAVNPVFANTLKQSFAILIQAPPQDNNSSFDGSTYTIGIKGDDGRHKSRTF